MGTVKANGIELWYEVRGDPAAPVVALIAGAASQATFWPQELLVPLRDAGFRVLRYDRRDIGLSEWVDFSANPYSVDDEAADLICLLDALSIHRAHVLGVSGGGIVAQVVGLDYPERVASLTLWMTSPAPLDSNLPQMEPEILKQVLQPAEDEEERIQQRLTIMRAFAGSRFHFDESAARARVEAEMARGQNPACAHAQVGFAAPPRTDRLKEIRIPTLVIHGDEDPALPLAHGELTASCIRDAKLVVLDGVGHEVPPGVCPDVLEDLVPHLNGAEAAA